MSAGRTLLKAVLGRLPQFAEQYQRHFADRKAPTGGYRLPHLERHLPDWVQSVQQAVAEGSAGPFDEHDDGSQPLGAGRDDRRLGKHDDGPHSPGEWPARRVLIFGYLPWWLEHAIALGLLMRSQGHRVELAYLPFRRWDTDPSRFDLRRQAAYLTDLLAPLRSLVPIVRLEGRGERLDPALQQAVTAQSRLDVQYSLQREDIEWEADHRARALLRLRQRRNRRVVSAALRLLRRGRYDSIIIPNGSILEFGALYRTACHLGRTVVTYEFGEQRGHLWLAQDAEVMRLPTDALWDARGMLPLAEAESRRLEELYAARREGRRGSRFGRSWQSGVSQGAQVARERLGLDPARPVALLCTNVVGDSLALDRQVFTQGMADWLSTTARHFARSPEAQLVVRVHPGEMLGAGHPSVDIVRDALPQLPPQVVLVPPESEINTYDLLELAHVGLVYTTTVGMEMAMFGVPAIVCGATHYRGKGFTDDPASLGEYLDTLTRRLQEPLGRRLPQDQIELAWRYAYRFFFEYPFAFPWHLLSFWDDMAAQPLEKLVASELPADLQRTLRAMAGEAIAWRNPQTSLGVEA